MFDECLTYDDVLIIPQFSDITHRDDVDMRLRFKDCAILDMPVVSAPMDTVTGADMVIAMAENGCLGILHRSLSNKERAAAMQKFIAYEDKKGTRLLWGAAIPATTNFVEQAGMLALTGAKVICIDVAHGHHIIVQDAIHALRDAFEREIHIMAGSVATLEAFDALAEWGADSIRVGIGGGASCSTRVMTGHGVPSLTSVINCARSTSDALLIADGGIRCAGDIVKAIAAGADAVMLGSMLAGADEAPGDRLMLNSNKKVFRGMASESAQISRGISQPTYIEGVSRYINRTGPVKKTISMLKAGLASGMSYTGARTLDELRSKARFIRQTSNALIEGRPLA